MSFTRLYSRVVSLYDLNYRSLASVAWLRGNFNSIAGRSYELPRPLRCHLLNHNQIVKEHFAPQRGASLKFAKMLRAVRTGKVHSLESLTVKTAINKLCGEPRNVQLLSDFNNPQSCNFLANFRRVQSEIRPNLTPLLPNFSSEGHKYIQIGKWLKALY